MKQRMKSLLSSYTDLFSVISLVDTIVHINLRRKKVVFPINGFYSKQKQWAIF